MRNRTLHGFMLAFADEAALQLSADAADGAGLAFEVVEGTGGRTPLYCYRPLTASFIRERIGVLGRLPAYAPAARALEPLDGVEDYLARLGEPRIPAEPRDRADAALRAFLSRLWAEASDFALAPELFARAYGELEAALYEGRTLETVVAPLLGLELETPEVPLGDGLALVRGDAMDDPPPWPGRTDPPAVLVLTLEQDRGATPALSVARTRFRRFLTALRLFGPGGFALGPLAYRRADAGAWQAVPLGGSGRPRGLTVLPAGQEDEARAFASLVGRRRPRAGEVAWALARFEMGCERLAPFEALTDFLLALRALLEPEGPASGRLAGRLAAICALGPDRAALAERIAHAVSLERAVIAGIAPAEAGVDALVEDLSGHLRALLRDVVCGHLDSDLRAVADGILAEAAGLPPEAAPVPRRAVARLG